MKENEPTNVVRRPDQGGEVLIGAVALMDALGFKGFWKKHGPLEAVRVLEAIKERFARDARDNQKSLDELEHQFGKLPNESVLFFIKSYLISDTVALVVATRKRERPAVQTALAALAVEFLGIGIAGVISSVCQGDDGLAYRGAIACGDVAVTDSFVVGAPVDEAAGAMEIADGALVWLLPSAKEALDAARDPKHPRDDINGTLFIPHRVPLKGGQEFETGVVNPFHIGQIDFDAVESDLLATFRRKGESVDVGVAVKRQHTAEFLQKAKATTHDYRKRIFSKKGG